MKKQANYSGSAYTIESFKQESKELESNINKIRLSEFKNFLNLLSVKLSRICSQARNMKVTTGWKQKQEKPEDDIITFCS